MQFKLTFPVPVDYNMFIFQFYLSYIKYIYFIQQLTHLNKEKNYKDAVCAFIAVRKALLIRRHRASEKLLWHGFY